jgi:hypothetical protein
VTAGLIIMFAHRLTSLIQVKSGNRALRRIDLDQANAMRKACMLDAGLWRWRLICGEPLRIF